MELIPALIVDDEYLIRSLVRNSVDWAALGFSIVAEAEDGEEALRLTEEFKPRLMIVDINIPFINGLDLSMRIRAEHPEICIVILTGYEDFQFARKAIKVGVVDYLLKPINPDELAKAVRSARESILDADAEGHAALLGAERSKEAALSALLSDPTDSVADLKASYRWNIDLESSGIVVCLLDIDPPAPLAAVRSRVALPCELFAYRGGRIVLLANEDKRTIRLKDKNYYAACESLIAGFGALGHSVSVGVSLPAADASALPEAYSQAAQALDDSFYTGGSRIHLPSGEKSALADVRRLPTLPSRESMIMMLRGGNARELIQLTQGIFRETGRLRASRPYCEMLCLEIILVVNEYLKDFELSIAELIDDGDDYYRLVGKLKTIGEMETRLVDLIKLSGVAVETRGRPRTHMVVKKAKLFIEKNYARKNTTLEQIAENAAVTPSYISTIFKKELGLSVIEYLTNIRLEAAKKIMDADPLAVIVDVATRVGYSDPYYFSKCFKKRYGSAPTAYLRKKNPTVSE